jgi:hypothetical protein
LKASLKILTAALSVVLVTIALVGCYRVSPGSSAGPTNYPAMAEVAELQDRFFALGAGD